MKFNELLKSNSAVGLDICIIGESLLHINAIVLRKKGNQLFIDKKLEQLSSMDALLKQFDSKTPLILSVSGKGTLHKKIQATEQDLNAIVNKAFPGVNLQQFVVQLNALSEEELFVSIHRKETFEALLSQLTAHNIHSISNCFLGPFCLNNIVSQLGSLDQFQLPSGLLLIRNGTISEIQATNQESSLAYKLGNEQIASHLLVPFANAASYFLSKDEGIKNSELLTNIKAEYSSKRKFEQTGILSLATAFILLLLNYFVFTHYWDKQNELTSVYSLNQEAIEQFDTLKKEVQFKQNFLEENGLLENSKTSYYADALATELPLSITWTSLYVNPVQKAKTQGTDVLSFENKTIAIGGKCSQSAELNQWMKTIKQLKWVKSVSLQNYTQSNKNEPGVFELRIDLN